MPLRIAIAGPPDLPRVRRIRKELCGSAPFWRADVVHAFTTIAELPPLLLHARLCRVRAIVWTPTERPGPPGLAWHGVGRLLVPSQHLARAWSAFVPLGHIAVVEPGVDDDGLPADTFYAGASDADDPESIVAAAARGSVVVSTIAHAVLPPGAILSPSGDRAIGDPIRPDAALARLSRGWAERGHSARDEFAALMAVYAEVASMARRRRVD